MRITKVCSLAAMAALFAGCSSGGSTPVAPIVQVPTKSTSIKGASQLVLTLHKQDASKRRAIGSRKPSFVSPSTTGVIAKATNPDINSGTAQYQGYTLAASTTSTPTSPMPDNPASCTQADATTGAFTCTLYFNLAPDSASPSMPYTVTITAYDVAQSGTTGTPASGSNALSVDTEPLTVTPNAANSATFTLEGIVRGFFATRQFDSIPNTAGTYPVTFIPLDADGNPITGADPLAYFSSTKNDFVEHATFGTQASGQGFALATNPMSITSGATDSFSVTYDGSSASGDGQTTYPGFGEADVVAPSDYVGYVQNSQDVNNSFASTTYFEPFFPLVDQKNSLAAGKATVDFYRSGSTITGYGLNANKVSDSSGYIVDDSACSSIGLASVSGQMTEYIAPFTPGSARVVPFGTTFTITSGTPNPAIAANSFASCTIKVYDNANPPPTGAITNEADITVNYAGSGFTFTVPGGTPSKPNARTRGSY